MKSNSSIFANLYYLLIILAFAIGIVLIVLLLTWGGFNLGEKLFPDRLHDINAAVTKKVFEELKSGKHYHQAIAFMEYKKDFTFKEIDSEREIYFTALYDCYVHVGDYSKAEKIMLDMYQRFQDKEFLKEAEVNLSDKEDLDRLNFIKCSTAKELFNLYDKMEDYEGMKWAYNEMEKNGSFSDFNKFLNVNIKGFDINAPMFLYRTKMLYYDNPDDAINLRKHYIDSISKCDFRPDIMLKFLNENIKWNLAQNRWGDACSDITYAIIIVRHKFTEACLPYLGDLSDYCYRTHDYENGEYLLSIYKKYINDNYEDTDYEYIKNQVRELKYLERNQDNEQIEDNIIEICENLKQKIWGNLIGMSEEQREFFVKLLDMPFDYASSLLNKRPSARLAKVCFENEAFKKGLLLRSSSYIRSKIKKSGDSKILTMYDSLVNLKKELYIRNEMSFSLENTYQKNQLKKKIENYNKQIVNKINDYKDTDELPTINNIVNSLSKDDIIVEYIDNGNEKENLYAITVRNKIYGTDVAYYPLCSRSWFMENVGNKNRNIADIYSDEQLKKLICKPLKAYNDKSEGTIYYSASGIFSQVALQAFSKISSRMHLVSSPLVIKDIQSKQNIKGACKAALWGGISYTENVISGPSVTRAITRGDSLCYLPATKYEVESISKQLGDKNCKLFEGNNATEKSFKDVSGKGFNILHISTHGFFQDDLKHSTNNPMHNCGLLFAGANKYWISEEQIGLKGEDGILRAEEIQDLDLSGCQLVILSACNTGLGSIDPKEGVYGLQRAFKLAGVGKIIMSMWPVGDNSTKDYMKYFYESLIKKNYDIDAAYFEAQKRMKKEHPAVKDWGAFVLLD